MFNSPLRYPGGKNKLSALVAKICVDNSINGHYVEPYAGGASVALFLLFERFVNKITINDKDRSIYAFWYSVLNDAERLCGLITDTDLTVENWLIQKDVQRNKNEADLLELGFSTLFLNRTNRSGIITGGIIGGFDQTGDYKMNCRFNKQEIIDRIKKIHKKRDQIRLFNLDAIELIDIIEEEVHQNNIIFYFDPPYYLKGSSLYMNHYLNNDHLLVSEKIKTIQNIRWVVSYDNHEEIKSLYSDYPKKEYEFNHSAYKSSLGKEVLFFSKNLIRPTIDNWDPLHFKLKKTLTDTAIIYKKPRSRKRLSQEIAVS